MTRKGHLASRRACDEAFLLACYVALRADVGRKPARCDLLLVIDENSVQRPAIRVDACGSKRIRLAVRGYYASADPDHFSGLEKTDDDVVSINPRIGGCIKVRVAR